MAGAHESQSDSLPASSEPFVRFALPAAGSSWLVEDLRRFDPDFLRAFLGLEGALPDLPSESIV